VKDIIVLKDNKPIGITTLPNWAISLIRIVYLLGLCIIVGLTISFFFLHKFLFICFIIVICDYIQPLFGRTGIKGGKLCK